MWLLPGSQLIFDVHTLLYAATSVIIGFQAIAFAVFAKIFAISEGLLPEAQKLNYVFRYINLEVGLIVGTILLVIGLARAVYALGVWGLHLFGPLETSKTMRIVIPSATSLALGFQIILSSFFLSILGLKRS